MAGQAYFGKLQSADEPLFRAPRSDSLAQTVKDERSMRAIALMDDFRSALDQGAAAARTAALRLVALFNATDSTAPKSMQCGGLAPWQKRKIDRFMRDRLEDRIQVARLAQEASLSVSHFCRAFKESFGETPHSYIIRLRLELAQKLMLTTDMPLSQIALACGLADQAHLSKLFRRSLAESPSKWRRRNLTEDQADCLGSV